MSTKMTMPTMPKKERAEELLNMSQKRPAMERYRVQVDRQTKASFPTQAPAEKAGAAIKKAHPKVHEHLRRGGKQNHSAVRLVGKRELRRGRTEATGGNPRRIIEIAKTGEPTPTDFAREC